MLKKMTYRPCSLTQNNLDKAKTINHTLQCLIADKNFRMEDDGSPSLTQATPGRYSNKETTGY